MNLGVATGCWVLFSLLFLLGFAQVLDLKFLDLKFRLRGERTASETIAIVGVDDDTISAYKVWPLPRDAYALLLTALTESGAGSVGVDFQFADDQNQDPQFDALLAYVSAEHPNIVHAVAFHGALADPDDAELSPDVRAEVMHHGIQATAVSAPEAGEMTVPYPDLAKSAAALGHTNVAIDPDGAIRRVPFFIGHEHRLYPALSLRVLGAAMGEPFPPEIAPTAEGFEVRWSGGGRLRLPTDAEGATILDYAGERDSFPRTYSMLQVLRWYRAHDTDRLREAFEGRIVLLGLTSLREVTEDIGTTPFSTACPLIYVHANALDGCLTGRFIRATPPWLYVCILGLLIFPLGWIYSTASLPRALLVAGVGIAVIAGSDQLLFSLARIDLPPALLLALPLISYVSHGSVRHFFLEKRSREREEDIRHGRGVQLQFMPEALVGQTLSHFHITDQIGRGGMSFVYRGKDLRLGRPVAIKVILGGALADEGARRRFRREARALSQLTHPHIAALYDFGSQDGADFLVLEYVEGMTLTERLRAGVLDEAEILRIGIQVSQALQAAHERGIIHRDLKPSNIMLTKGGWTKVLDFGLARIGLASSDSASTTPDLTASGAILGTIPYMAPEVLQGRVVDHRVDVYGVGMVLYEMAVGRRPFVDDAPHELLYTILNQEPPEPKILNRRISATMDRIILKAIEKDPDRRQQSAAGILQELEGAMDARGRA